MRKRMKACIIWLMLFFLPTACLKFERVSFPEKRYFMMEVSRTGAVTLVGKQFKLRMQRLSFSPEFAGKNFVYRTDPMTYEQDYYNGFFIAPGSMLTRKVRQWLQDCGLFQYVSDSSGLIDTPYVLQGEVTSFYADFSEKSVFASVFIFTLADVVAFDFGDVPADFEIVLALKKDVKVEIEFGWWPLGSAPVQA